MVRIACAQLRLGKDQEENYQKALDYLHRAKVAGAQLVCFPEGQLMEYIPQYAGLSKDNIAIPLTDRHIEGFRQACREEGIIGVFSLVLTWEGKIYPTMMIVDERGKLKPLFARTISSGHRISMNRITLPPAMTALSSYRRRPETSDSSSASTAIIRKVFGRWL